MKLRKIVPALLLSLALPAMAEITTLIDAVETSVANINVPPGPNGRLSFKACGTACDDAELIVVRLTPATIYTVRGQVMNFKDFRKAFYNLRAGAEGYALVTYDTERDTVTSVLIAD